MWKHSCRLRGVDGKEPTMKTLSKDEALALVDGSGGEAWLDLEAGTVRGPIFDGRDAIVGSRAWYLIDPAAVEELRAEAAADAPAAAWDGVSF